MPVSNYTMNPYRQTAEINACKQSYNEPLQTQAEINACKQPYNEPIQTHSRD